MIYGYARVSTLGQEREGNSLADQVKSIRERYNEAMIVKEAFSGAKEREKFTKLINELQEGDTLVVTKLDRFCRATKEGLGYIDTLMNKGVRIHILNMGLIEDTPMGRLIVTNLLAFAEFERAMILERTTAGKVLKKKTDPNYREGRNPISLNPEISEKIKKGVLSVSEGCRLMGISRSKWYRNNYSEVRNGVS